VQWDEIRGADGFVARLNRLLGTTKFRLPTEQEWERAARAGTQTPFWFGDPPDGEEECEPNPQAEPHAWWCGNSGRKTHPVGSRKANPYGLFDMHGNVGEWIEDNFRPYPTSAAPALRDQTIQKFRVIRGGNWVTELRDMRCASRGGFYPDLRDAAIGFRLAMTE
jgi:formylglycine-generating enzyme required for sulfatase activity